MVTRLVSGVNLHVIPTKKYKTIRVMIRFCTRLNKETITKRALLSSLLETSSFKYSNQNKVSEALAELYGAGFGTGVSKKGNLHFLTMSMNIVNEKYINEKGLLADCLEFLKEMLFHPNIIDGKFDSQNFKNEKENLYSYLQSIKEDKKTLASLNLQELYFGSSIDQGTPSFGVSEDLADETPETLAAYYQKMITQDEIEIIVLGDVEEKEIQSLFEQFPFSSREQGIPKVFYEQPTRNVIEERIQKERVVQSKLNLGYSTSVYYGDRNYFAFQVFNGIFGGFPHSKLFVNVREKEHLAYYASSSIDTFRGFLSVQTGIDGKNRNKVLHLIAQELEKMKQGKITDDELLQTQSMLKNQYVLSLDNPAASLENCYIEQLVPNVELTDEQWLRKIDEVTIEDVVRVAKNVHLQAIFFLEGELNDD